MFNFQGPAALSVLVDSLLIIQHQVPFVKNFFEVFSDFLKVFQPPQNPHKLLLWAFQRMPLAGQFDYITTGCHTLSTGFFEFFDKFRAQFLGSVYIVVAWRFGTSCGGRWRLPQNRTGEQCSPLQGGGFVYSDQTTPNMIQRISGIFERNPLISKEI